MSNIFGTIDETLQNLQPPTPESKQPSGVLGAVSSTLPSYFYGTTTEGGAFGRSDELDTSGRPLFGYRKPGDLSTTTDRTRVATTFDPRVAKPLTHEEYYNPRAEGLRAKLKNELGVAYSDELDHAIALALSGSNQKDNLRPIPKDQNREYGVLESRLAREITKGNKSLFDAQIEAAKAKGISIPYTGKPETSVWDTLKSGVDTLLKPFNKLGAMATDAMVTAEKGIYNQYKNPTPDERQVEEKLNLYKPDQNVIEKYITTPTYKFIFRTLHPALAPFAQDLAEIRAVNEPGGIADQVKDGKIPPQILDEFAVLQKTAPQIVGDTAMAVLTAYSGGVGAELIKEGAGKGALDAFLSGAGGGLKIGTLFGGASALASGETDATEITKMIVSNGLIGSLLGGITSGTIPVSKEVFDRAVKAKDYLGSIPGKQGGYLNLGKDLGPLAEEARKYKSAEEFVNSLSKNRKQNTQELLKSGYTKEEADLIADRSNNMLDMKSPSVKEIVSNPSEYTPQKSGEREVFRVVPKKGKIENGDYVFSSKEAAEKFREDLGFVRGQNTIVSLKTDGLNLLERKGADNGELIYLPKEIQTKSQLTDFYNKATESSKSSPGSESGAPGVPPQEGQPQPPAQEARPTQSQPREIISYKNDTTKIEKSNGINLDNFKISQAGKDLINRTVEDIKPKLEEKVGKKLSNSEAMKIAEDSSRVLDNAVSRETTAKWEGSMLRARQILARDAESGRVTPEFIDALLTIKTHGTDIARKLQSFSIGAEPKDITGKQAILEAVLKVTKNADEVAKAAQGVDFTNLNEATNFYRKYIGPKTTEWLDLIRYNSMLSSPKTHIINTFSNAINSTVIPLAEKMIAGGVDFTRTLFTGKPRTQFSGEAYAYARNYLKNIGEAHKRFIDVMRGRRVFTNLDTKNIPIAASGWKGKIVQTLSFPMKLLEGMDQFFTALTESGELGSLNYRSGKGVKVLTPEVQAIEKAAYRLYRQGLTPETQGVILDAIDQFTSKLQSLRNNKNPIVSTIAKYTVPFLRTPMNIFKQGIEYSPTGFTTMIGAQNKVEQFSKAIIGSAVFSGAASMLMSNRLSWAEPVNPKEKAKFRAEGKQPYSMKIGDTWYSYQKLPPPIAFPFALAAAIDDTVKNQKIDDNTTDMVLTSVSKYGQFLADQSYAKSIGDLISSFKGGESSIEQLVSNYPQQLIPFRALSGWITRLADQTQRKVDNKASFIDKQVQLLMMSIPGLSETVPARTSPTGEAIPQPHPFINAVSPVNVSTEKGGSGDLPPLPSLPKLPDLKTPGASLPGNLPTLPKLPSLKPVSENTGDSAFTKIARALGVKTAEAATVPQETDFSLADAKKHIAFRETGIVKTNPYVFSRASGDGETRDLGKYQVNENTLMSYAKKFLGRDVTPEEFLKDPKLQEKFIESAYKHLTSQGVKNLKTMLALWKGGWGNLSVDRIKKLVKNPDIIKYINNKPR